MRGRLLFPLRRGVPRAELRHDGGGDGVTFETTEDVEWDSKSSRREVVVSVTVAPVDPDTSGFTTATVVWTAVSYDGSGIYSGAYDVWEASWVGTLRSDWPADASFRATSSGDEEGGGESWDDGTCAWSYSSSTSGIVVEMNTQNVWVGQSGEGFSCNGLSLFELGASLATVDGETYGLVDPETWEDLAGTDADGDHWTVEAGDCDDGDASVYCWADEIPADGIDQDCDGSEGDTGTESSDSGGDSVDSAGADSTADPADSAASDSGSPSPRPRRADDARCASAAGGYWMFVLALLGMRRWGRDSPR